MEVQETIERDGIKIQRMKANGKPGGMEIDNVTIDDKSPEGIQRMAEQIQIETRKREQVKWDAKCAYHQVRLARRRRARRPLDCVARRS